MSQLEWDESTVLRHVRAGFSPGPAARERVRLALGAAVALSAAAPAAVLGVTVPRPPGLGAWASRVLLASTLTVAAGSFGYWAGYRAGRDETRVSTPPGAAVPAAANPTQDDPAGFSAGAGLAPANGPEVLTVSPPARPSRLAAPGAASARPKTPGMQSLEAEVRALRSIERALRDGQPGLARALLQRLEREQPHGRLIEEREATAAIVRCTLGDVPFGVDPAQDFADRNPASLYLERVKHSCATVSDSQTLRRR